MTANLIEAVHLTNTDAVITLPFGTCNTAATVAQKEVNFDNLALENGATVVIKFAQANTATGISLRVTANGTTYDAVKISQDISWDANAVLVFTYIVNGNDKVWTLVSSNTGPISGKGITVNKAAKGYKVDVTNGLNQSVILGEHPGQSAQMIGNKCVSIGAQVDTNDLSTVVGFNSFDFDGESIIVGANSGSYERSSIVIGNQTKSDNIRQIIINSSGQNYQEEEAGAIVIQSNKHNLEIRDTSAFVDGKDIFQLGLPQIIWANVRFFYDDTAGRHDPWCFVTLAVTNGSQCKSLDRIALRKITRNQRGYWGPNNREQIPARFTTEAYTTVEYCEIEDFSNNGDIKILRARIDVKKFDYLFGLSRNSYLIRTENGELKVKFQRNIILSYGLGGQLGAHYISNIILSDYGGRVYRS